MISMRGLTLHPRHIMESVIIIRMYSCYNHYVSATFTAWRIYPVGTKYWFEFELCYFVNSKFEKFEISLSPDTVFVNLSMIAHWELYQIQN